LAPDNIASDRAPGIFTGRGDLEIGTPVKICGPDCSQTVIDSGMVTVDSL